MKYCMRYNNRSRYLNTFDEVILKYEHKTSVIIEHVQNYKQEQRVILNLQDFEGDILDCKDILLAAAGHHPQIAIMGTRVQTAAMKEMGLPWFYGEVVDSWDKLNGFIKQGVSDVIIGNEFAFNMANIALVCKEANVKVRVYPNVAQSNCAFVEDTMKQFYIRPEDVSFYKEYVDVMEFYGPAEKQDVLYDIYTKGRWLGNLKDLILGLKEDINNTVIAGCFGVLRINCSKRCSYSPVCDVCNRFISINNTIQEAENGKLETNEVSM